jgi:hypothetical protein
MDFRDYLIQQGWKCYTLEENLDKHYLPACPNYVSSYGPLGYHFENESYPDAIVYWGLMIKTRGPIYRPSRKFSNDNLSDTFETLIDNWQRFMMNNDFETILNHYTQ